MPLFQNESKCEAFHIKMSSDMKGQSVSQEWFRSVIFATGMFQENTNKLWRDGKELLKEGRN